MRHTAFFRQVKEHISLRYGTPALLLLTVSCGEPAGPRDDEAISLTTSDSVVTATVATVVSLRFRVRGDEGRPLRGVVIRGTPTDSLSGFASEALSDASGEVTLPWTLGTRAVTQQLSASVVGRDNQLMVVATVLPGPIARLDSTGFEPLSVRDTQLIQLRGWDAFGNALNLEVGSASLTPSNDVVRLTPGGGITGTRPGASEISATVNGVPVKTTITVQPYALTRLAAPRAARVVRGTFGSMVASFSSGLLWQTTSGWIVDSIANAVQIFPAAQGQPSWASASTGESPANLRLLRYASPGQVTQIVTPGGFSSIAGAFGDTVVLVGGIDTMWVGPSPWRAIIGRGATSLKAQSPASFVGLREFLSVVEPIGYRTILVRYDRTRWSFDTLSYELLKVSPGLGGAEFRQELKVSPAAAFLFETLGSTKFPCRTRRITRVLERNLELVRSASNCLGGPSWDGEGLTDDGEPFLTGRCVELTCTKIFAGFLRFTPGGDRTFYLRPGHVTGVDGGSGNRTILNLSDSRGSAMLFVDPLTP